MMATDPNDHPLHQVPDEPPRPPGDLPPSEKPATPPQPSSPEQAAQTGYAGEKENEQGGPVVKPPRH